jgi:hypothetical protein
MKYFLNYFILFGLFLIPLVIFFIVFLITKKSLKKRLSHAIFFSVFSLSLLSTVIYLSNSNDASLIDIFGNTIYYGSVYFPVVVFFCTIVTTKGRSLINRLFSAFFFTIASIIFFATLWIAIIFRDGLGPNSISSNGSVAINRSIDNLNIYWLIFSFAFFILGFIILKISSSFESDKNKEITKG